MANIVKALKKGNQTLTNKVRELQQEVRSLEKENEELKIENYQLWYQINSFAAKKKTDENDIIHCFAGMFHTLLNAMDK